tara:strand:- start:303 stop:509 length:207 start_codon:yes stop_codon:yes gene_type:complete
MNKEEINKTFFEDLHQIQMNQINNTAIEDARKAILGLLLYSKTDHRDDIQGKDEAIENALKWLKDNPS